jgi:prephenate dehydrogenase
MIAMQDSFLWEIASTGFRDTTRLAASNVEMSLDILLTNRDKILEMTRLFQEQFNLFIRLLEISDETTLRNRLSSIQNLRKQLYVTLPS